MASRQAVRQKSPDRFWTPRQWPALAGQQKPLKAGSALLALALLIGGGGPHSPFFALLVEFAAIALIGAMIAVPRADRSIRISRGAWLVIVGVLLLFTFQLVSLPMAWWTVMPGRATLVDAIRIVRGMPVPHPMTIDPRATVDMLIAISVPLAVFGIVSRIDLRERLFLAGLIVASALIAVFIEGLQFAGVLANFYVREGVGSLPTGLFANHNHQATLHAVAITMLVPLGEWGIERYRTVRVLGLAVAAHLVLVMGVIATQSRGGAVLTVLASLWLGWSYWRWWRRHVRSRKTGKPASRTQGIASNGSRRAGYAFAGVLIAIILIGFALASTPVQQFIGRFSDMEDKRISYLPDLWSATSAFLPWGSGFGTYPVVFRAYESLDQLSPTFFNHAHNDYYELLMEGGYPAMAVLLIFVLFLVYSMFDAFVRQRRDGYLAQASVVAILLVMAHSFLDYPLRTHAIAAVFGFLLANIATRIRRHENMPA